MAIALKENRPVRGVEAVAEKPDGTLVPFVPFPTPLRDEAGRLVGAVNMLIDISDRKQSEAHQRMLLDELNHRVKNNLQMLHGLLLTSLRETSNSEARAVLGDASQRVGALAAAQRLLYTEKNPRTFSKRQFVEAVCEAARQSFDKDIRIKISTGDGFLSNEASMPLALILNELLTNAAKHGVNGRGEGEIEVSLRRLEDGIELTVQDHGPGFELNPSGKRSSGLGLVRGMVRQLAGTFTVENNGGARCVIRFPGYHA